MFAAACGGGGNDRPPDAGVPQDGGAGDGGAGDGGLSGGALPERVANAVVGRNVSRCTSVAGATSIKLVDASTSTIQVLQADATVRGGFRVITGTGKADGTFRIDGVPEGTEYMLRYDGTYHVSSARVLDIHDNRPQRCDPAPVAAAGDPVMQLQVSNMTPFQRGDDLIEVHSFNLLYQGLVDSDIAEGETALAASFAWKRDGFQLIGDPVPLLDAASGDDLVITHVRIESMVDEAGRLHNVTRLLDVFQPRDVTLVDGATTAVTGAFVPAGSPRTLTMAVSRGEFDRGFDATTAFRRLRAALLVHPIENDFGVGAQLAGATFNDWSGSAPRSSSVDVEYADPFPAAWSRALSVSAARTRQLKLPETTVPASLTSTTTRSFLYTGGNPALDPTLSPPRDIKVGGSEFSAGGMIPFNGVDPVTISWSGVASADLYILGVFRVVRDGTATVLRGAGTFTTAGTSLQIPADALSGGPFFVFELSAVRTPSRYVSGELTPNGPPVQFTEIPSGMFRFTATCGNAAIDTGEDCDAGAETGTCDVDCTPVECGDGLRNAAAGEACDAAQDTEGCDADCTLPVCGDGHVNRQREDCDDGNTQDGDGCTADCTFSPP